MKFSPYENFPLYGTSLERFNDEQNSEWSKTDIMKVPNQELEMHEIEKPSVVNQTHTTYYTLCVG